MPQTARSTAPRSPLVALLLPVLTLAFGLDARADYPKTPQEFALLPPYCRDRMAGAGSPGWERWKGTFGNDWQHMHHYCAGLDDVNKATRAGSAGQREQFLKTAIGQFDYLLQHGSPKFFLRPEIGVQKGKALQLLGQDPAAATEYSTALRANPKYAPAYVALGDLYQKQGRAEDARNTWNAGLKAVPNNQALRERLAGKGAPAAPATPAPVTSAPATPESAAGDP